MVTDAHQTPRAVDASAKRNMYAGREPSGVAGCGRTHRGCRRAENQDRMYVGERVFAVADGIGGYRGGGLAAEIALEPVSTLDQASGRNSDIRIGLRDAVHTANAEVRVRRQADPSVQRMGTTLTAMVLDEPMAHIAHVGDSRLYRMRGGVLDQLTADHTFVARLVEAGRLAPAAADDHPKKSLITRAVGIHAQIGVDVTQTRVQDGDVFLICSDGLPSAVNDATICTTLASRMEVTEVTDRLVQEAIRAGAHDNVTAVVVHIADLRPRDGLVDDRSPERVTRAVGHPSGLAPVR